MVRTFKEDFIMIIGTHNSATGGKLVWWLKPIGGIINLTSKCQNRTITQQLQDGVSWFNLQVTWYKNQWRFSHGLALYQEDVMATLEELNKHACVFRPIYIQLYLDKSFWGKKDIERFNSLVHELADISRDNPYFRLQRVWVEGSDNYYPFSYQISNEEHYWTLSWAKVNKGFLNKLPLPKYHAKKFNPGYIKNCSHDYLMLDFYNIHYTVQKA